MSDLFVFMKDRCCRSEIKVLFGLSPNAEDGAGREIPGGRFYLYFDSDILKFYPPEELNCIPYKVQDVCNIAFYPFEDVIDFLLDKLESYDSSLFADDDHENVMNIVKYRKAVRDKKIYPFA